MVQVAVAPLQLVLLEPGVFGVKLTVPVAAASAAAGAVQAFCGGAATTMLDNSADTAEFM